MKTQTKSKATKQSNASTNNGNTNFVELQNRTEQSPAAKTNKTAEQSDVPTSRETEQVSGAAAETQPQTATQDAPVRPYVNFAERDFNRKLSVEKVLEKLERF